MKKNLILIVVFLNVFMSFGQDVPFETLEKFSKEINDLQRKAEGKIYSEGKFNVEVSFPETSFIVYFHNQLATSSIYKKWNDREILALSENIDLSKSIGIKYTEIDGEAGSFRIYFPEGSIKTQIFEEGELVQTLTENYVELFYDKSNENDKNKLLEKLNQLIAELKKEKDSTELIKNFFKTYFVKTAVKPYGDVKIFDYEFTNDALIIYRHGLTKNQDDVRNPYQWYHIKLSDLKIGMFKTDKFLFDNLLGLTISNVKGLIPHGNGKKFVKVQDTKYTATHIIVPFKLEAEFDFNKLKEMIAK